MLPFLPKGPVELAHWPRPEVRIMTTMHTILHPIEFATRDAASARLAWWLPVDHQARLVLLHVVPPPVVHGEVVARRQDDDYYATLQQSLDRMKPAAGGLPISTRLEEGDVASEIVRVGE